MSKVDEMKSLLAIHLTPKIEQAYYGRCIKRIEGRIQSTRNDLHNTDEIFSHSDKDRMRGRIMEGNRTLEMLKEELTK